MAFSVTHYHMSLHCLPQVSPCPTTLKISPTTNTMPHPQLHPITAPTSLPQIHCPPNFTSSPATSSHTCRTHTSFLTTHSTSLSFHSYHTLFSTMPSKTHSALSQITSNPDEDCQAIHGLFVSRLPAMYGTRCGSKSSFSGSRRC